MITIDCTFLSGIGHLEAKLYRNGTALASGSINVSGTIPFADAQSGDTISIDGVCTGSADIQVSVPTTPATPQGYPEGNFFDNFIIL